MSSIVEAKKIELPLSTDHSNGEMFWVPTWIKSIQLERSPRGAQLMAFLSIFCELELIAFMTMVEPLLAV